MPYTWPIMGVRTLATLKEKKKHIRAKLEEYLGDVGFPDDGYELNCTCTYASGFVASINAFCVGADRLLEEWDLVSGDFADEVQDMYPDTRVEISVSNVSEEVDDVDEDGGEVFKTSHKSSDDDEDIDSDTDQYEEEGLNISDDDDLLYFTDEYSVDDPNIDDLTLKDVLNTMYDEDMNDGYIPSEEDLEEFGFYDEDEDRRSY